MPVVSQINDDGEIEEFFYADPVQPSQSNQHDEINVDQGIVKIDGDLNEPLVIKKTLDSAHKYIVCKTDQNNDQFTVSGVGEVRCQDIGCDEAEFTQGVSIGNNSDVAVINSSGLQLHKSFVMSANPGDAPPTFMTEGTVVAVKDGQIAFVPYDEAGNPISGHVYKFGRQTNIGDLTHDNDGMLMRKTALDQDDGSTKAHGIHISPDPTDPNILISSKKHVSQDGFNYDGYYLRCQNSGPDEEPTPDNVVFQIDNEGRIESNQIIDLAGLAQEAFEYTQVNEDRLNNLEPKVNSNLSMLGEMTADISDIDASSTNNLSMIGGLTTDVSENAGNIVDNATAITALINDVVANASDIAALQGASSSSPTYTVYDFSDNPVRFRDHDASNSSYSNPIEYTANGAHTKMIVEISHQWKQGSEAVQSIVVSNSSLTANSIVKAYMTLQTHGDTDFRAVTFTHYHLQIDNVQRIHFHLMHKNFSSIEYTSNGDHFEDGDWWTNVHLSAGSHFIFHVDVIEPGN